MPQVACATCHAEFYKPPSLVHKTNFCNQTCRLAFHPSVTLTCEHCGKVFRRCLSLVEKYGGRFCSLQCFGQSRTDRYTVACVVCGKEMVRRKSELEKSRQPFCSKKCQGVWIAEHDSKRVLVACEQCGKPMRRKLYKLKDNTHQFCSRRCMHAWQSENWIGPNHHGWKGGRDALRDYGPNWKMQACAARNRDGYKCRACGKIAKKHSRALDVHHIKPFRQFGYIRGQNETYRLANELTNLVTLCRDCHAKVENGLIALQPYLL